MNAPTAKSAFQWSFKLNEWIHFLLDILPFLFNLANISLADCKGFSALNVQDDLTSRKRPINWNFTHGERDVSSLVQQYLWGGETRWGSDRGERRLVIGDWDKGAWERDRRNIGRNLKRRCELLRAPDWATLVLDPFSGVTNTFGPLCGPPPVVH